MPDDRLIYSPEAGKNIALERVQVTPPVIKARPSALPEKAELPGVMLPLETAVTAGVFG
jgi:hypothetical protein